MKVVRTVRAMRRLASDIKREGRYIGFVPTMGALHEGHLSLIRTAGKNSDVVVCSIFVNPAQFGPAEDYRKYPRNPEEDLNACRRSGVNVLFIPSVSQMYSRDHCTYVVTERLTQVLCGPFRPGHFRGVTTVLMQFFNIIRPHQAYFGQKDYQQAVIVRQMVEDMHLDMQIIILPTVREPGGLAMSSRNAYLSPAERRAAPILYQALSKGREAIRDGESRAARIRSRIQAVVAKEPLVRLEYVEICDPETLQRLQGVRGKALLALAAWIGKTRLIDNLTVGLKSL